MKKPEKKIVKKVHANQKAENPEFRDKNILLHKKYSDALQELAKAEKGKSKEKIERASSKLEEVKNEFFNANKGLAYSMAKSFLNQGNDLGQDYYSAASLGIWEAFLKWDPTIGVTFGTFSRQFIKGRISRTVRQSEYNHISQGDFNKRKEVREALLKLQEKLNRTPTYEEIAKEANVTATLAERALQSRATSLDAPVGDGESTLNDIVNEKFAINDLDEFKEDKIEDMLKELGETELWIVLSRGDILGVEPLSLVEIADSIGIGREIARRIEQKAKYKLIQSKLSIESDSLPELEEVAEVGGYDISEEKNYEEFRKMIRGGYAEIKGRWERASKDILNVKKKVRAVDSKFIKTSRLDRIGEEFISSADRLITQMGSTYSKPGKRESIGIDEMSIYVWERLNEWDEKSGISFEAYCRGRISRDFTKLNRSKPDYSGLDLNEVRYLWSKIKRKSNYLHGENNIVETKKSLINNK